LLILAKPYRYFDDVASISAGNIPSAGKFALKKFKNAENQLR
jgi:hypothetical protein